MSKHDKLLIVIIDFKHRQNAMLLKPKHWNFHYFRCLTGEKNFRTQIFQNFRTISPSKTSVNVDDAYFLQASHQKKICHDRKIMKNRDISRTNMGQKRKIDKKACLYVTNIGVDLSGNLVGSSPFQVRSLLSKMGVRGWYPRENFENQY